MKKADNPFLRFPQYTGDLVPLSLEELSESVTSGSRDWAQFYASSGAKFIRMTNLLRGTPNLDLSDLKYVNVPKDSRDGLRTRLETDDVLVSITAELGKVGLVPSDLGEAYINQHIALIKPKNTIIGCFLANYLTAPQSQKRITRLNDSGAKAGLNLGTIKQFVVNLPDLREQQKIADFLTAVDTKINQLTEKHRLLKEYKKGVMQQIFSQQLRFKDKDGKAFPEWKEEAIGKYLEPHKELVSADTDLPVLTSSRTGLYLQERSVNNEGEYGVVPFGYFTYRHMSDDLTFKFNVNRYYERGAVSKEYPVFKTVGLNTYFLEIKLNEGKEFKRFAIQQKQGGTRTRLYFKNLKELKIAIPCLEEQQKIAHFLQALDSKIIAVSEQIEQTKQFKKGLLQQMFV